MSIVCDFDFVIQNKRAKKLISGHLLGKASKADLSEVKAKIDPYYKLDKSQVLVIKGDEIKGYIVTSFQKDQIWIDYYDISDDLKEYVDLLAWLVVDSAFLNHGVSVHLVTNDNFDVFRSLGFNEISEMGDNIEFKLLLKDVTSKADHPLFKVHRKYEKMLIERNKTETAA